MKDVESHIAAQLKVDRNTCQNLADAKRVSSINRVVQWRISILILKHNFESITLQYKNKVKIM